MTFRVRRDGGIGRSGVDSLAERDVFGARQQAEFILVSVPVLPETAALNGAV